jgi:hypothetical protein
MFRALDIFPKATDSELRVRTNTGGVLTLLAVVLFIFSVVGECILWQQRRSRDIVSLVLRKGSLPPFLPISISLTVYNACPSLHSEITNYKRSIEFDTEIVRNAVDRGESCDLDFRFTPPTVPASFHVGLGGSFVNPKTGEHSHMYLTLKSRNLSHVIKSMRFGDLDAPSPLDDSGLILPKRAAYMIIYTLTLIPQYARNGSVGYQLNPAVMKVNLEKIRTSGFPGIIFQWAFSPMAFEEGTHTEPGITLVSRILALASILFMFGRSLDGFVFAVNSR